MLLGNSSPGDRSPKTSTNTAAPVACDQETTASISRAINADPMLKDYGLNVRTIDGNVTISGTVGSYPARDRIVEIASGFSGPKSLNYRIAVDTRL